MNIQENFYSFAITLADETRKLILELLKRSNILTELKDDKTPVTNLDKEAELLLRARIQAMYPDHGITGEEYPSVNVDSDYLWTLDPIDGTQNLINSIPTFGTLIGLRYQNEALVGIIDHPLMNLRVGGGKGLGVRVNGKKCRLAVHGEEKLGDIDLIATNNLSVWGHGKNENTLKKILAYHPHSRIYYDC